MSRSQCHIISTEKAFLDSPVSSTGQALRRASLEFIRRMLDGMTYISNNIFFNKVNIYMLLRKAIPDKLF